MDAHEALQLAKASLADARRQQQVERNLAPPPPHLFTAREARAVRRLNARYLAQVEREQLGS